MAEKIEVEAEVDDAAPPEVAENALGYLKPKPKRSDDGVLVLSVLAGIFIAFGGAIFIAAGAGSAGYAGGQQLAAALGFSVGLILCIVAGAELFTGNTLLVISGVEGHHKGGRIVRFWALVWAGNLAGSFLIAFLFVLAGAHLAGEGAVGLHALQVGDEKMGKGLIATFTSGILANMLVCLAVWMAQGARTIPGKVLAIIGPVAGFVVLGFEHSVANMSLLPIAGLIHAFAGSEFWQSAALIGMTRETFGSIGLFAFLFNLIVATLGNIVGGAAIGLAYWYAYLRKDD